MCDDARELLRERAAMIIELAQSGAAARLGAHQHAVEALHIQDLDRHRARDDRLHGRSNGDERRRDVLRCGFIPGGPFSRHLTRVSVLFLQRVSDSPLGAIRKKTRLGAAQPKGLPDQVDHIADPDFLETIGGLQRGADAGEQLVIAAGIFALDQGRRPKQGKGCERLRSAAGCAFGRSAHLISSFLSRLLQIVFTCSWSVLSQNRRLGKRNYRLAGVWAATLREKARTANHITWACHPARARPPPKGGGYRPSTPPQPPTR